MTNSGAFAQVSRYLAAALAGCVVLSTCTGQKVERPTPANGGVGPSPAAHASDPSSAPSASLWLPDRPEAREPRAFGMLPRERQTGPRLTVRSFELSGTLPPAPTELAVYLVGSYPATHRDHVSRVLEDVRSWIFIPEYSLVQYRPTEPTGIGFPIRSADEAADRATQFLSRRGLLLRDSLPPIVVPLADQWRVLFHRRVSGIPVYTNKGLVIQFDRSGRITDLIGRRRPLESYSTYPLRSVEDAWRLVLDGKWITFYVDDGGPPGNADIERFIVRDVELAYVEAEVVEPLQIMQPFFVFRNEQRRAVYVPAVAPSHVTWP